MKVTSIKTTLSRRNLNWTYPYIIDLSEDARKQKLTVGKKKPEPVVEMYGCKICYNVKKPCVKKFSSTGNKKRMAIHVADDHPWAEEAAKKDHPENGA